MIEFTEEEIIRIETFKKTYSAVYVQSLSNEKLDIVKSHCNLVQQRLIDNLENDKTYMKSYIEGPTHLYIYELPNNKTVHLFGETHRYTENHCQVDYLPFANYIDELSMNSPSFFDLYIEMYLGSSSSKLVRLNSTMIYKEIIYILLKNSSFPIQLKLGFLKPIKTFSLQSILSYIKNADIEDAGYKMDFPTIESIFNNGRRMF